MIRFLKAVALAGIPFALLIGLLFACRWGAWSGIRTGLACGLAFGVAIAAFQAWQRSRFTRDDPTRDGEWLLQQGPANHFVGWEAVGGWLYLTNQRLLFRSHRVNLRKHELSIPLEAIDAASPCLTGGIIPNGLRIATAGRAERFVVSGRRRWIEAIARARRPQA